MSPTLLSHLSLRFTFTSQSVTYPKLSLYTHILSTEYRVCTPYSKPQMILVLNTPTCLGSTSGSAGHGHGEKARNHGANSPVVLFRLYTCLVCVFEYMTGCCVLDRETSVTMLSLSKAEYIRRGLHHINKRACNT